MCRIKVSADLVPGEVEVLFLVAPGSRLTISHGRKSVLCSLFLIKILFTLLGELHL